MAELKKMAIKVEDGKAKCACCGIELRMSDMVYGRGLCLDCAYHTRDTDIEDVVGAFPIKPDEVITNDSGTLTVLVFRRPTAEECGA